MHNIIIIMGSSDDVIADSPMRSRHVDMEHADLENTQPAISPSTLQIDSPGFSNRHVDVELTDLEHAQPATSPPTVQIDSPGSSSGLEECYLCCDGAYPGDPLISGVCSCRQLVMHERCQRRMLETALKDDAVPVAHVTRCSVCHAPYTNVSYAPFWQLSWLGAMWLTCCLGVGVMLWSGFTVLDKGSSVDPAVDYSQGQWWTFQFSHPTWCNSTCLAY